MNFITAFYADRNNMQGVRIIRMMIMLCLFGTIMALQSLGANQSASFNSITYNMVCSCSHRILNTITFLNSIVSNWFCLEPVVGIYQRSACFMITNNKYMSTE